MRAQRAIGIQGPWAHIHPPWVTIRRCNCHAQGTEDSYKLKLEATPGVPPHVVHLLQLPVYDMGQRKRVKYIRQTALMADPASPAAPALVAALEGPYGNTVLTYDMETLRVRHKLLGHLYTVTDIAVPPPSWQTPGLFATASRTGDVKVGQWVEAGEPW